MKVEFAAQEYNKDTLFRKVKYTYEKCEEGWKIYRNDDLYATLDRGYKLVATEFCGVCATDISRHHHPFPLPQITGHEVIGHLLNDDLQPTQLVVIEINDSHLAHASTSASSCSYCNCPQEEGMDHHCPARTTIGIDRFPGGFAPYILAPVNAIVPVPSDMPIRCAALAEPFAAALQAVEATPPMPGYKVAVLGPRRLGMSIIAALVGYKKVCNFEITAIGRHQHLLDLCTTIGADKTINTANTKPETRYYDIVFDTTGTESGFELALSLTKKILHLKSTCGTSVFGMQHFTQLVVDEGAILPFSNENLNFTWTTDKSKRTNANIFVSPTVKKLDITGHVTHQMSFEEAVKKVKEPGNFFEKSVVPRFDLAIVSSMEEADKVIRPLENDPISLIRPKGAILITEISSNSLPNTKIGNDLISRGISLQTSRCGDLHKAINFFQENPKIAAVLEQKLVTHIYPLEDINNAFDKAKQSDQCIKVLIKI